MIDELKRLKFDYEVDKDLSNNNTLKLLSKCYIFININDTQELLTIIELIKKYHMKYFIIGNGSNIILPKYYDGVVIKLNMNKLIFNDGIIYVESGYMLNKLALCVSDKGYTGFEWATGIPGTIGGAIYSNAGAYKSSISDYLVDATIFDGKEVKVYSNEELKFGYRDSILRSNRDLVVLSCTFKIEKGNIDDIKSLIKDRTDRRLSTQDLSHPSCGSVFRNPEGYSTGKLVEDLGLKGTKIGGASISKIHGNFIINDGGAIKEDVVGLIKLIQKEVKNEYNIDLILEPEII